MFHRFFVHQQKLNRKLNKERILIKDKYVLLRKMVFKDIVSKGMKRMKMYVFLMMKYLDLEKYVIQGQENAILLMMKHMGNK